MVPGMAMSRPLSFQHDHAGNDVEQGATRMMSVRMRNITVRSTWIALKNEALVSCQVEMRAPGGAAARSQRRNRG